LLHYLCGYTVITNAFIDGAPVNEPVNEHFISLLISLTFGFYAGAFGFLLALVANYIGKKRKK
jgi:hypothetical protein